VPTLTPVMMLVLGEDMWAVVRATLVRDAQAVLPEADDEPKPDDEPEPDDEPDDEPKPDNEPDDEADDDPDDDPGTLYFGARLMDGPILLQPTIRPQPPGGADTAGPAGSMPLLQGQCANTAPPPVR
jgi:hypothetical protein